MSLDVTLTSSPCPHCGRGEEVFSANITHNLNKMAGEAGIYEIVWRPEEHGIKTARQLIKPLEEAIKEMRLNPARFKKHDAPNKWGIYEDFLPWLEKYLEACKEYPEALVSADR